MSLVGQPERATQKLRTEAANHGRSLHANNQAVYSLLLYGVPVKTEASSGAGVAPIAICAMMSPR